MEFIFNFFFFIQASFGKAPVPQNYPLVVKAIECLKVDQGTPETTDVDPSHCQPTAETFFVFAKCSNELELRTCKFRRRFKTNRDGRLRIWLPVGTYKLDFASQKGQKFTKKNCPALANSIEDLDIPFQEDSVLLRRIVVCSKS